MNEGILCLLCGWVKLGGWVGGVDLPLARTRTTNGTRKHTSFRERAWASHIMSESSASPRPDCPVLQPPTPLPTWGRPPPPPPPPLPPESEQSLIHQMNDTESQQQHAAELRAQPASSASTANSASSAVCAAVVAAVSAPPEARKTDKELLSELLSTPTSADTPWNGMLSGSAMAFFTPSERYRLRRKLGDRVTRLHEQRSEREAAMKRERRRKQAWWDEANAWRVANGKPPLATPSPPSHPPRRPRPPIDMRSPRR